MDDDAAQAAASNGASAGRHGDMDVRAEWLIGDAVYLSRCLVAQHGAIASQPNRLDG
jgi:hypothetical protein